MKKISSELKTKKITKKNLKKRNKKIKLSLIIPTINSEKFLRKNVLYVYDFLKHNKRIDKFEIILSTQKNEDNTLDVIKELCDEYNEINFCYSKILGKGRGINEGIKKSRYSWIMFIDDDLSYPIEFLNSAFDFMDDFEVIIGSRYLSNQFFAPISRKITSKVYLTLAKILFELPYSDVQAGIKIFNREIFNKITLPIEDRFVWDTEFMYYVKKYRIKVKELPVSYYYVKNQLKLSKDSIQMFLDLLNSFFRIRVFRKHENKKI